MKTLPLFLTVLLLLCSHFAFADNLTISFTGTVTSTAANAVAISEVQVGDEVTGQYSFDTNSLDSMAGDTHSGLYDAETFSLTVNGYRYSAEGNNISVTNDAIFISGQPAMDAYEVVTPLRDVSGPSLSGLPIAQIDLVLVDTDSTVFSDDSLPTSLDINEFEITSEEPYGTTGGRIIFQSLATGGIGEIRFEITEISVYNDSDNLGDGWKTIQGTVTYDGTPLCAMVLANGQYMFSCEPDGEYQLSVPLDGNGEITLFAFVDGLAPFKVTSEPSSLPSDIEMQLASPDSKTPAVTYTAVASIDNPGWIDISGFVSLEGTPLCAMVLANGQYMFSCDPNGEYQLSVPLDPNGEITLFVFVDGLQPYKEIFSTYFTQFQESVLDEINYIRTNPSGYAETRLKSYYDSSTDNGAYTDIKSRNAVGSLELQSQLCSAASKYAQYLAENNVFGHYENGSPIERCEAEGYDDCSGENIGAGSYSYYNADEDPATAAGKFIVFWVIDMNVDGVGHRENIMSSTHKKLGAGFFRDTGSTYENYAVLDFGSQ